jgi:hypothetical protein
MPPTGPPSGPPSSTPGYDPIGSFDPSGSKVPGTGKILAIVGAAFFLVALLAGGILLFAMSG